jgi:hypothetical protein
MTEAGDVDHTITGLNHLGRSSGLLPVPCADPTPDIILVQILRRAREAGLSHRAKRDLQHRILPSTPNQAQHLGARGDSRPALFRNVLGANHSLEMQNPPKRGEHIVGVSGGVCLLFRAGCAATRREPFMFRPLAHALPSFPGFDSPKTYAAWPVWRDSTTEDVKFTPLPKRQAVNLFHKARNLAGTNERPIFVA